jgi:hypothetical protein
MITDCAIDAIRIQAPSEASRGSSVPIRIDVTDNTMQPIMAVVPVQVSIADSQGRLAEFSGFYGAKNGELRINVELARNDVAGPWEVRVKELASGKTAAAQWNVE